MIYYSNLGMNTNKLVTLVTLSRIPLSIIYVILLGNEQSFVWLWILFVCIEASDILDGYLARKTNSVTDAGKVLDPASDVLSRLAIFIGYAYMGKLSIVVLLILFYREMGMTTFRLITLSKKTAIAANWLGKTKSISYSISIALILLSERVYIYGFQDIFSWVSAILSVISFGYYILKNKHLIHE